MESLTPPKLIDILFDLNNKILITPVNLMFFNHLYYPIRRITLKDIWQNK